MSSEVWIYTENLDKTMDIVGRLTSCLDEEERARADRFAFAVHKRRFLTCRILLRTLLACVCKVSAREINFKYGQHGRPSLAKPATQLDFNVSHADEFAVIALSPSSEVGVDVERLSVFMSAQNEGLSESMLTASEQSLIDRCDTGDDRSRQLLRYWTAKEAYMKLVGTGLTLDPRDIEIEWNSSRGIAIATDKSDHKPPATISAVDIDPDVICAVATPRIPLSMHRISRTGANYWGLPSIQVVQ